MRSKIATLRLHFHSTSGLFRSSCRRIKYWDGRGRVRKDSNSCLLGEVIEAKIDSLLHGWFGRCWFIYITEEAFQSDEHRQTLSGLS